MSAVNITRAEPHEISWRVGNSLTIESTREAVEHWTSEAELTGHASVDGLTLTLGDLFNMHAAMDDAWANHARSRPVYTPPREDGALHVHHVTRDSIRFAIGDGPWTYTSPAKIRDAMQRREEAGTTTVQLSGHWLDEEDLEVMNR